MSYHYHKLRLFFLLIAATLVVGGCGIGVKKTMRICPGKEFASEAITAVSSHSKYTIPLKASGQCRLEYYVDSKKHKENFPIKLWLNPPSEIYLQGDVAFDAKGIVLGSNEEEFWLSMKPKEISGYWWGQWQDTTGLEKLIISPKTITEAFGIVGIGEQENWALNNENGLDVFTKRNRQNITEKKIYVNCCDYLIRKIDYFNSAGKIAISTELAKYKEIARNSFVPTIIKIRHFETDSKNNITITLKSAKPAKFTEKMQKRLFVRPQPKGFEHIYKIINGEIIRE